MNKSPIIEIKNVSKKFNNLDYILNNISFNIYRNEVLAILGKSGCGKSTLFKILIGVYKPTNGNVIYQGEQLNDFLTLKHLKKIVGFVYQDNSFYEKLTVYENLFFYGKVYKLKKKEIELRIDYLLSLVNLEAFKHIVVEKLSGGMKRRVEFAISLIHDPKILILDEPFTGLDSVLKEQIWRIIKKIKSLNVAVILSTHDLGDLEEKIDRAIVLKDSKIIKDFHMDRIPKNYNLSKIFQYLVK